MATCYNSTTGRYYYCQSGWYDWGRWVLLGILVAAALFFFFVISCITSRRRRKAGRRPMYGTGWATTGPFQPHPQFQSQQPQYNQPAPAYNTNSGYNSGYNNNTGANSGYYGQNQSYFGGQQTEMQAPPNVYRGEESYAPPSGPPPNKH